MYNLEQQSVYLILLGMKSQLGSESSQKVDQLINEVEAVIARHGDEGKLAVAIVGAKLSIGEAA